MTSVRIMPSARRHHEHHNEIIFERIRKSSYRAMRTLVSEIVGNYQKVCQLSASFVVFCSAYVFALKCVIQSVLQSIEIEARSCEANMVYHPPAYSRIKKAICSSFQERETTAYNNCICYSGIREEDQVGSVHDVECLTLWLRERKFRVSLDDNSQWNDGVLMYTILCRVTTSEDTEMAKLDPSKRVQNWSLNIKLLNSWYPGLIQNSLLLHCISSSGSVNLLHVVEILTRLMHARRRIWRGQILRNILYAAESINGVLKPRVSLSGPGMVYAKLNMRNEFVIKTKFPCPAFTIEFENENGEMWRQTSTYAKLNCAQEYAGTHSVSGEGEIPLQILRVTKYHYRIFYIPRMKGTYKISIKPGTNKAGHVYGSPFFVQAELSSYWRESMSISTRKTERASLITAPVTMLRHRRSGLPTSISEQSIQEELSHHLLNNSNGTANAVGDRHDFPSADETETRDLHRHEPGRITSALRMVKTRLLSVSDRLLAHSTQKKRPSATTKRRTYADVRSRKPGLLGSVGSRDLAVPSSRNLKIRKVIIHRYLNEPMPSLEQYLFGQGGFTVDNEDGGDKIDALKKWSNVSALLRIKIKMMNKNINEEETHSGVRKARSLDHENGRRRRLRLRTSADTYRRRQPVRRTSSDIFQRMNTGYESSSSSESGYDANDTDCNDGESDLSLPALDTSKRPSRERSVPKQEHGDIPKRRTISTPDVPRFDHIFCNQEWLTDIFLDETTPRKHRNFFLFDSDTRQENGIKTRKDHKGWSRIKNDIDRNRIREKPPDPAIAPQRKQTIEATHPAPVTLEVRRRSGFCSQYAQRLTEEVVRSGLIEYKMFLPPENHDKTNILPPKDFTRNASEILRSGESNAEVDGSDRRILCRT